MTLPEGVEVVTVSIPGSNKTATFYRRDCKACGAWRGCSYDAWEDCYLCQTCGALLYPEDYGQQTNREAGVFHIGEQKA